jgi:thiol-disulfide isomerase/thioredoxin
LKKSYLYLAIAAITVAMAVVAAVVVFGHSGAVGLSAFDNIPVPQSLMSQLNVPSNVSSAVGIGLATNLPRNVSGNTLIAGGKPAIVYVGADYCPYCAIARWGLVVALLRFGTFTGLEYMTSSPVDIAASTPTFTFYNATYSSPYISFVSAETAGNKPVNGSYPKLQNLTAAELAMLNKYDPGGGIPFIDFANQSVEPGSPYADPTIFGKENWSVITNRLYNTSSIESRVVLGSANLFTAAICKADGNQPASVCGQAYITSIEAKLK